MRMIWASSVGVLHRRCWRRWNGWWSSCSCRSIIGKHAVCDGPQEPMEFLGYRIGRNYRFNGSSYIGTRPSKASVQSLCRKVSEQTSRRYGLMDSQDMVRRLNWMLSGWSNYFCLGLVSPAYLAIDHHTTATVATIVLSEASGKGRGNRCVSPTSDFGTITVCYARRWNTEPAVGVSIILERKPDAGNPHVRFDERGNGNVVRVEIETPTDGESRRQQ